jgi:hypothetical protein
VQISPCISKGDNAAAFKHFNSRALAEMLCKHYTVKLRTNGLPARLLCRDQGWALQEVLPKFLNWFKLKRLNE